MVYVVVISKCFKTCVNQRTEKEIKKNEDKQPVKEFLINLSVFVRHDAEWCQMNKHLNKRQAHFDSHQRL